MKTKKISFEEFKHSLDYLLFNLTRPVYKSKEKIMIDIDKLNLYHIKELNTLPDYEIDIKNEEFLVFLYSNNQALIDYLDYFLKSWDIFKFKIIPKLNV